MRLIDIRSIRPGALLPAVLLSACATTGQEAPKAYLPAIDVPAQAETDPVGTGHADAADDPAIWRNAADPAASLIVATDKKAGLYVYGLDGKVRDFVAAGALNNVDLREVTRADGTRRILVAASDRTDKAVPRIALFWLDGTSGKLTSLGAETFFFEGHAPAEAYGFCMGGSLDNGDLARAYVVLKDGTVAESGLYEHDDRVVPEYFREVKLATQSEGCVVDDATQTLFIAEEYVGIWKVPLQGELKARPFARVGVTDGLVDDVEGLGIAREASGRGWLVASSQGDNAYALFDLGTGKLAGRFRINGGAIDGTSDTDGIEVALGDFGPQYPEGLFIAQDGDNAPQAQNFKLLSWRAIREALGIR
ncbi:phytase [Novosphingobium sp. 2580]|uniref:Phytase n=2 Tax=Novosphingobium album (ex Hu et al. 2023) TaxID=2930093 RepID=A0ABT0B7Q6_9SPHN|nr:phytase [Novosphingobium album (ex Hu et al. 2023)]MCJ2180888.1 phytase [Novosphingobium album (ex Hu et al. 2023)]